LAYLWFRDVFAILAGGTAIAQSPGWTGPPTNRVGMQGGRATYEWHGSLTNLNFSLGAWDIDLVSISSSFRNLSPSSVSLIQKTKTAQKTKAEEELTPQLNDYQKRPQQV